MKLLSVVVVIAAVTFAGCKGGRNEAHPSRLFRYFLHQRTDAGREHGFWATICKDQF